MKHCENVFLIMKCSVIIILVSAAIFVLMTDIVREQEGKGKVALHSIALNKTSYNLNVEESEKTFASALYSNGFKKNISKFSTYSTSNPNIAAVDSSGVITGVGSGTAEITVIYEGLTETVSVSVSEKKLTINVKDYGAYGDGIHDDTNSFHQAIDDLADNGGGDIFIPSGTYILQPIFLKPNIALVGQNRDQVILKLADEAQDGYTRLITMDNNTKVESITCDGNYQNHPNGTEHMHCIFAFDKNNLVIKNNRLMNAVGDGISISGSRKTSRYVTVSNNMILENQRSQLVVEQANHLFIFNNTITSKTGRPGIHFEPWEEIQFFDAVITNNNIITNSKEYCVLLAGSDSGLAKKSHPGFFYHGIEFSHNTVEGPECSLLVMDTSDAEIYNNKLLISDIFVWRRNKNLSIHNNYIEGENGVRMEGGENGHLVSFGTIIYQNTIHSFVDGINVAAGAKNTTITNNKISGMKKGSGIALFASNSIVDTTVTDNVFSNFRDGVKTSSVKNEEVKGLTVSHNRFIDNNGYALSLQGEGSNVKMESNHITRTSGVYFLIEPRMSINKVSVKDNVITGGSKGIYQSEIGKGLLAHVVISDNEISETTGVPDGHSTGAAIEFYSDSGKVKNITISGNFLIDNEVNEIRVPDSLLRSVKENRIN